MSDEEAVPSYWDQLVSVVRSVRVIDELTFSWFGRRIHVPAPSPLRDETRTPGSLQSVLARYLYELFYVVGAPVPADVRPLGAGDQVDDAFVDMIRAAAVGIGPLERNWKFVRIDRDGVVAERDGIVFLVPRGSVAEEVPGSDATGRMAVRQPLCLRTAQPGFCLVFGNVPFAAPNSGPSIRFYWNIFADGAIVLTRALTKELNDRSIPFALKLLNTEAGYTRCDSTVLYVPAEHLSSALDVVALCQADIAWALEERVPALTKRIALGVGAAEDPGSGESFGQHRCRLLAEALRDPTVSRSRGVENRSRQIARWLEARGVSIAAPYLNRGSPDLLVLSSVRRALGSRRTAGADDGRPHHSAESVATAARVGEILLEEALWSEDECTWMGPRHEASSTDWTSRRHRSWSPVGGDVYSGTAGIACFLAALADLLHDDRFARAAKGALLHSARRVQSNVRPPDASFYLGWTGVVFCLLRFGRVSNSPELTTLGEQIARERLGRDLACDADDWLTGLAGSIAGLLALAREGMAGPVVDAADRLGRTLLGRAIEVDGVSTWRGGAHARAPLTGLAHGGAGIALALAELAAATGDVVYRTAASRAVEYERRCFSRTHRNWPDFRRPIPTNVRARRGRRYATAWCHGAPGIALARMRMWKLLGEGDLLAEAVVGFETTLRSLEWLIGCETERMVLCHGLSGNLMIVRKLEQQGLVLPMEHAATVNAASRHLRAAAGLARVDRSLSRWIRETPSLLTGAAGIGSFLLSEAGADGETGPGASIPGWPAAAGGAA
jgi:Lanthionine synthetase C-like protein/HopA1 effector protein family